MSSEPQATAAHAPAALTTGPHTVVVGRAM